MSTTSALSDPASDKKTRRKKRRRSPSDYVRAFRRATQRKLTSNDADAMSILHHLEELRIRLTKAGIALVVTTGVGLYYSSQLVDILTAPIGGRSQLVSIEVTENISVFMRVALMAGIILGLPLILHQAIGFLSPGLTKRERRWLYTLIPVGAFFFLMGVAFTWFVMIPPAVDFLMNFLSIPTDPRPIAYINFITSLLFWIGLSFEMPLVIFFMAKLKWVTARHLVRGWRYAIMGIGIVAAAVTPTIDPINMGLVMLPLAGLYIISIFLAWIA